VIFLNQTRLDIMVSVTIREIRGKNDLQLF